MSSRVVVVTWFCVVSPVVSCVVCNSLILLYYKVIFSMSSIAYMPAMKLCVCMHAGIGGNSSMYAWGT